MTFFLSLLRKNDDILRLHVWVQRSTCVWMAAASLCVGCGSDLTDRTSDRSLQSNEAVLSTWKDIIIEVCGDRYYDCSAGIRNAKFCRKCFSAFQRYQFLHDSIKENAEKFLGASLTTNPKRVKLSASSSSVATTAPLSTSSVSPDVAVSVQQ